LFASSELVWTASARKSHDVLQVSALFYNMFPELRGVKTSSIEERSCAGDEYVRVFFGGVLVGCVRG
jgi:hypothetical protein